MTFWEKFYKLCVSHSIKPNTVAKDLGFSSAVCTQWKQGKQKPSYEKASKIAKYFGINTDYLLSDDAEMTLNSQSDAIKDKIFRLFDNDGYRQDDLADYLGVPEQVIRDWESGQNKDYMKHLEEIAKYFDVNIEYFYEEEKNKPLAVEQSDLYNYLLKTYSDDELLTLASLSRNQAAEIVELAKKMKLK